MSIESEVGRLLLVSDGDSITGLTMENHLRAKGPLEDWDEDPKTPVLAEAARQLRAYFAGELTIFDLPLAPHGTEFQQAVWACLLQIPYGVTRTYGELATELGRPTASRAVGAANGRNPISIVIPCHRVVGSNGKLTGYAGGTERKGALLAFERGFGWASR